MIQWIYERARKVGAAHEVAIVTSDDPSDDGLAAFLAKNGIKHFRGPLDDVLSRYYLAAKHFGSDIVVRLTGDCPLLDPGLVDAMIREFVSGDVDFLTNCYEASFPDGLDASVFSMEILTEAYKQADLRSEREHVVPWMWKMSSLGGGERFKGRNNQCELDLSQHRWTVDEEVDYLFIQKIIGSFPSGAVPLDFRHILKSIEDGKIERINSQIIRDEGLARSIAKDEKIEPPKSMENRMKYKNSLALFERAKAVVPSVTQTFSKGYTQFSFGSSPIFLDRAEGSQVWDVDGNAFLDLPCALGPILFGHKYGPVDKAVKEQIDRGVAFSLPHHLELTVAEKLVEMIPHGEMVRFGKNGSDATAGAVRAARALTGRKIVACCGYHGWQDWYIGTTLRNKGVPEETRALTKTFNYNDISSLASIFDQNPGQVAAVIMEPMGVVFPKDDFLQKVRDLCDRNGAIMIFDECWTGFRLAKGGAAEYFGVLPDMSCFGKALGNGYALSAVVGRRNVMEVFDEIFFSFTFAGDALGLAAANAVLDQFQTRDVLGPIWEKGRYLMDGVQKLIGDYGFGDSIKIDGYGPKSVMSFKKSDGQDDFVLKSFLQQIFHDHGILYGGYHVVSEAMTKEELSKVIGVYDEAFGQVKKHTQDGKPLSDALRGGVVSPVFRKH